MPGKNEPKSEYKKRFRWHDSHLVTTLKTNPELAGPSAGIPSATLGKVTKESLEPPLQQRRKLPGNDAKRTYTTNHFYNPTPSSSEDGAVPRSPTVSKSRSPTNGHRERHRTSPRHKGGGQHGSSPRHGRGDARIITKNHQNKKGTSGPKDDRHKTYSKLTNGHHPTERAPVAPMTEENSGGSSGGSKSKGSRRSSNDSGKSSRKPHDVDAALQYQAGVRARPLGPRYMSEYQRQFAWKQTPKESPLIAADELIHKSSTNIAPFDPTRIPKKTEYNTQFKAYYPPPPSQQQQLQENAEREMKAKYKVKTKSKKHKKNSLSPEQMRTAGKPSLVIHEDADRLRESQNPQKPFFPHAPVRKWKSEYHSNFKSPSMFSYEGGVWKGAKPPHLNPQDSSTSETERPQGSLRHSKSEGDIPSWFAEVLELRNRAQEYQRRAHGTHFSRERLVQLWSEGANQPTDDSSTSSLTTSSDAQGENRLSTSVRSTYGGSAQENGSASQMGEGQQHNGRDTREAEPSTSRMSPVRRKLAWDGGGGAKQATAGGGSERRSSYGSIPTPEGYRGSVSGSSDDFEALSENGRLPTPRLDGQQTRHHLDKTTPAVGGAILTSPPRRLRDDIPRRPATAPTAHGTPPPYTSAPVHRTSPQRRKSPARRATPPQRGTASRETSPPRRTNGRKSPPRRTSLPQRGAVSRGASPPHRTNGFRQLANGRASNENHHNEGLDPQQRTRGVQVTKSLPGRVTSILPGGISKAFEYDSDEDEVSSPLGSSDEEGTQDRTLTPPQTPPRTPPRVTHNGNRNLQSVQTSPTAGKSTKDPDPLTTEPSQPFQRHSNHFFEPRLDVRRGIEPSSKTWAAPTSSEHPQGLSEKTATQQRSGENLVNGRTYNLNRGPLNRPNSGNLQGRPQTAHPQTRQNAAMDSSSRRLPPEERPNSFIPSSRPDRAPPIRNDPGSANHREEQGSGDLSDISTMSTSSSISLASEVLDRAKKRRDDFWGKKVR